MSQTIDVNFLILLNLKDLTRTIGVLRIYTKQHADHESLQYFFYEKSRIETLQIHMMTMKWN